MSELFELGFLQQRQIDETAKSMGHFASMARELQWKMTQEDAAVFLKIDLSTLQAVEAGSTDVSIGVMLRVWQKMQVLGSVQAAAINAQQLNEAEVSRDAAIHEAIAVENLRKQELKAIKASGPRPMSAEALKVLLDPSWGNANKLDVDEPLLK